MRLNVMNNALVQLTKRHFLVFFKNKIRVVYTALVPLVLFLVYIVFLRQLELTAVNNTLLQLNFASDEYLKSQIEGIVDSWMLSGIVALSIITVSIQTNNIIVNDKEIGVNRDFVSSPISRRILTFSYFLFNFIVTWIISFIVLLVCLLFLLIKNNIWFDFPRLLLILAVLTYSVISSTLITIFICSFISKEATMASVVAIFSTAVGFLIGAYMPLAMLPDWMENICALFPGTYTCGLLRYAFLGESFDSLLAYLNNGLCDFDNVELIEELSREFGYNISFFEIKIAPGYQALILLIYNVIFSIINIFSSKYLIKLND